MTTPTGASISWVVRRGAWRPSNTVGITPRKENIPLTIDANYVVGFD